jgi:hypothetical protein
MVHLCRLLPCLHHHLPSSQPIICPAV